MDNGEVSLGRADPNPNPDPDPNPNPNPNPRPNPNPNPDPNQVSLGRAAIFCINGQVRPEMAALGLGLGSANPTHPSPSPSPSPNPNPNPNQVRPEMAALQRARRSGTDRDALGRAAQTVLRFLTLTLTQP
eukprot:scaffold45004_cov63-Phaeocystis_antarctica.AAC.3